MMFVALLLVLCVGVQAEVLYELRNWSGSSLLRGKSYTSVTSCPGISTSNKCVKKQYPSGQLSTGGLHTTMKFKREVTEATLSYGVRFDKDFDFVSGGKLPGLWGGRGTCSGGTNDASCFSARLMWRAGGAGEVYAYIPKSQVSDFCSRGERVVKCNSDYGHSVGRKTFYFRKGVWTNVSEYIKLNDPGQTNGKLRLFINGDEKITMNDLNFRESSSVKMNAVKFSTFFGGSKDYYRPSKTETAHFYQFVVESGYKKHKLV